MSLIDFSIVTEVRLGVDVDVDVNVRLNAR